MGKSKGSKKRINVCRVKGTIVGILIQEHKMNIVIIRLSFGIVCIDIKLPPFLHDNKIVWL